MLDAAAPAASARASGVAAPRASPAPRSPRRPCASSRSSATLRAPERPLRRVRRRPAGRRSARTGRGRSRPGTGAHAGAPARPGWRCAGAAGCARRRPRPARPAARARGARRPRRRRCAPSCGSRAARVSGRPLRSSTSSRLASRARGLVGLVALPHRRGQQRRQHAGERAAPAEVGLGARQRRPQQLLGQQHLAFPQVGQADDEVAPAAEVAVRRAALAARRLLLAQARERRLAVEQRAERRCGWRAPAAAADRCSGGVLGPGVVQRGEAVGVVGEDRRAAQDQRALAAQRVVDAGLARGCARRGGCASSWRSLSASDQAAASSSRGRRSSSSAGSALEPLQHGALAAARHQRFVEAALGQLVGGLALAGRERMPRGGFEQAVRREPRRRRARAARPARSAAAARSGGAARRARAHACAASRSPRRRRRPACRAPAAPAARRRRRRRRRPRHRSGCSMSRIEMRVEERDVGRIEVGQQQVDELVVQRRRRCAADRRDLRLRVAAGRHHRQRELQAERPALGQLVQARGRVAVDARAEAAAHQLDRLVEPEAQLAPGRRAMHCAVGDQVVDLEPAVGARRDHGAQVGRRVAQQVGQRLARRRRAAGRPRRRSGRRRAPTARPRRARPSRLRGRSAAPPSSSVWPKVGRPAAARTASARPARSAATSSLRLRRQPGHDPALRQMLAAPLREQRGLAEAGRRLHQDHRAVAQALVVGPAGAAGRPGGAARAAA